MIVVDTSALIEIVRDDAQAEACMEALVQSDTLLISAGSLTECIIVAHGHQMVERFDDLFDRLGFDVIPVTKERARAAGYAYRRYGKGWHAAGLNYGDCFAYALAIETGYPLLFVGKDFEKTDVKRALA